MKPSALLLALALSATPALGQNLAWTSTGSYSAPSSYGRAVSSLADVDGDGYRDLLVGDPLADPGGVTVGEVRLLSGLDGSVLHTVTGPHGSARIGFDVSGFSDADGDGIEDYVLTSNTEFPELRSGSDGALLRTLAIFSVAGGQLVERLRDIDGDGYDELLVGNQDHGQNHGQVLVVNGRYVATGNGPSVRWSVDGLQPFGFLGTEVANAGDVNGDGVEDVLAGSSAETAPNGNCGVVRILSGTNGMLLGGHFSPSATCTGFGAQLSNAGDWNGDGVLDQVVGAVSDTTGGNGAGAVRVFSGLDGALLREHIGQPGERFGSSVLGGIDIDGDGTDEVLFGALTDPCGQGRGTVYIIDPSSMSLDAVCGEADSHLFGQVLESVGDVEGDGTQDFSVTDPENVNTLEARVFVFGGECRGSAATYCSANPNSSGNPGSLVSLGLNSIAANNMRLLARFLPPDKAGLFFYGSSRVNAFHGDGVRCAGGSVFRLRPLVVTSASGHVERALDFSAAPLDSGAGAVLPGSEWNFQLWFRDPMGGPAGFNYTSAVSVRFCP